MSRCADRPVPGALRAGRWALRRAGHLTFVVLCVVLWLCGAATALATESGIKISRSADGMLVITGGGSPRASASPGSGIVVVRRDPPGDLAELFAREARVQGLDRRLVEAVAQVESAFDIAALSSKGAIGVMQLMPETARELGVDDPWDPAENVSGGTRYLRRMLDRFGGHLEHALAAYNAGPSAVERYGGIPPYRETVDYVKKVLGVYRGEVPAITPRSRERARPQSAPIRVERDAQGRLVLTTP